MNQNLRTFLLNRIAEDETYTTRSWPFSNAKIAAECAAKRSIVEQLWTGVESPDPSGSDPSGTERLWVLRTLATVYADHPDFREEWRA